MASNSPYQLETVVWRTLLGRAAIFYAARKRLGELHEMNDEDKHPVINRALDALNDAVDALAATTGSDAVFTSALVNDYGNRLVEIIRTRPRLADDEADLLKELQSLIRQTNSTDPFEALLSSVSKFAAEAYGDYWRVPRLSLKKRMGHPRPAKAPPYDPYPLSAATSVQQKAVVQLSIYPPRFGPAAFAAIPFIFVHECVCHVPARQDRNRNASPFAEGLMAWAARFFFQQWVVLLDHQLAPAARQHGDDLQNILKADPVFYPRNAGYRSADGLMAWFNQELGEPPGEAEVRVARLAVELNLVDVELDRKDNFVYQLRKIDEDQPLGDRLKAWADGSTGAAGVI